jgi:RimJ/RimL family protein N-acetyltransferase
VLETERLTLRGPEPQDLAPFTAFMGSERSRFVGGPRATGEAWRAFAAQIGQWSLNGYGMWVVTWRDADAALGMVGCWNPAGWPEPELAWSLFDGAEGRGVATEAAEAARACAFERFGWTAAVSYVAPENARSRRVAERLGCAPDETAAQPFETPVIVYRHPAPEARP